MTKKTTPGWPWQYPFPKRIKVSSKKPIKTKIAVGCGKVMESRRKVTKYF